MKISLTQEQNEVKLWKINLFLFLFELFNVFSSTKVVVDMDNLYYKYIHILVKYIITKAVLLSIKFEVSNVSWLWFQKKKKKKKKKSV